jgi:hypothetical protein
MLSRYTASSAHGKLEGRLNQMALIIVNLQALLVGAVVRLQAAAAK